MPNQVLLLQNEGGGSLLLDLPKTSKVLQQNCLASDEKTQTAKTATATITIAELLTGILDGTPTAAATYTFPTAALMVAGIPGCKVGMSFRVLVNAKAATHTITVAAGSGGTADGTLTVATAVIREFVITITNVTSGSEAYALYGLGA